MRIFLIISILLASIYAQAQQSMSTYFMRENYTRLDANPAFQPSRGYIALPGIGEINLGVTSNSLRVSNLLYTNPNGKGLVTFLDPNVSADQLLQDLRNENRLSVHSSINMISTGFFIKKNFITLSLKTKVRAQLTLPESFFHFAKQGPGETNQVYDMRNIEVLGTAYSELGMGLSKAITPKLQVGTRIKFLAGLMSYKVNYDQLYAELNEQKWYLRASGTMEVAANKVTAKPETTVGEKNENISYGDFDIKPKGPAGYGIAIDLGITYSPITNLNLSAGIIDLGYLWWQKKNLLQADAVEEFQYQGAFEVVDGVSSTITNSVVNIEDITRFVPKESQSQSQHIEPIVTFGAEYDFLNNRMSVGLLSSTTLGSIYTTTQLMCAVNFRPTSWFTGTVSYALLRNNFDSFGVALNFHPSWINFFIGTDHLGTKLTPQFIPVDSRNCNLFVGIGIPLRKAPQH